MGTWLQAKHMSQIAQKISEIPGCSSAENRGYRKANELETNRKCSLLESRKPEKSRRICGLWAIAQRACKCAYKYTYKCTYELCTAVDKPGEELTIVSFTHECLFTKND
jgi:hypothetical protein